MGTEVAIAVGVGYLLCGVSGVQGDLSAKPGDAPGWTYDATARRVAFWILAWPLREAFRLTNLRGQGAQLGVRDTFGGALGALTILFPMVFWVWLWIWLSEQLASPLLARIFLSALLLFAANAFLMPLFVPLSLIVMTPIGLLIGGVFAFVWPPPHGTHDHPPPFGAGLARVGLGIGVALASVAAWVWLR